MTRNTTSAEKELSRGFTMMELVIVIVAFGIVGMLSVAVLRSAGDVYWEMTNRGDVVQKNRIALTRIAREISLRRDLNNLLVASDKELQVVTPQLDTLAYSIVDAEIKISKNGDVSRVLADHVVFANSSFAYRDSSGIDLTAYPLTFSDRQRVWTVDLTVETAMEGDTLALQSAIFPENLQYGERMPYHE